jgi:hypothetical protein
MKAKSDSGCTVEGLFGELSEIIISIEDVVRHCKEMDYIAVALMLRGDTDRLRHVKENLIPNSGIERSSRKDKKPTSETGR